MVSSIQAFHISEVMNEKGLSAFLVRVNFNSVTMVNLCSAVGCKSGTGGDIRNAIYRVPKYKTELKSRWL